MARHNYKIRPAPHWEDGNFIPATPVPVQKPPSEWSLLESLQSIQTLARNAVEATTLYSMTDMCAFANSFGIRMWVLFGSEREVLLSGKMLTLAYTVLSDTLFSGEIEEDAASVLADIAQLLNLLGRPNPMDMLKFPAWIPRLNRMRGLRAVKRVRAMISDATDKRMAAKARGEALPDDFLTLLINSGDDNQAPLTRDEIEDQMITFIGAGHETTSRAMTWRAPRAGRGGS